MGKNPIRLIHPTVLILILTVLLTACSTGPSPVLPPDNPAPASIAAGNTTLPQYESNRYLWELVTISYDPATNESRVIPARDAAGHWNVLKFMEQGPCTDCVLVLSHTPTGNGTIEFDIELSHPFSNPNLTGFNVRGIALFNGSHAFPVSGLTIPDRTLGDGQLVNASGYTRLYNSTTAGQGPGGFQGYFKGKMATPTAPGALLNGYIPYASDDVANTRDAFYAGDYITRTFEIAMPTGAFVFGYAVDASWAAPTIKPVTNPMTDFPTEANCPEPWAIEANVWGTGLTTKGGSAQIWVHVFDYGLNASHHAPVIECPELWTGEITLTYNSTATDHSLWFADLVNATSAPAGTYKCLVSVEDNENATAPAYLDLTAYDVADIKVSQDGGWAQTWGGPTVDAAQKSAIDMDGNVLVTGSFEGPAGTPIDFDPGPEVDDHLCQGGTDIFISKYDQFGEYIWTVTIGGTGNDAGLDIDAIGTDLIRVCGYFSGTVDFDPTSGEVWKNSGGGTDAFFAQYNVLGELTFVNAWGGSEDDAASSLCEGDSLSTLVVGSFRGNANFQPGGSTPYLSNGGMDCYLSKFDSSGLWFTTLVWGGPTDDNALGVDAINSETYITGFFSGTADFDPGIGTDPRTSAGILDGFLLKLASDDSAVFTRTWGGTLFDEGRDVVATSDNTVFTVGYFQGTADFNPYGSHHYVNAGGLGDAFLLYFSTSGMYGGVRTWGDTGLDIALSVDFMAPTSLYVGGSFEGSVDFGPFVPDIHASNGFLDASVTKYTTSLDYEWTRTFGSSTGSESVYGVTAFDTTAIYLTGVFEGTTDFDPGTSADDHSSNGALDAFLTKYFPDGGW